MFSHVNKMGNPGGFRPNPAVVGISAKLKRVIMGHGLMQASDYEQPTSSCVRLGSNIFLHRDHHYALVSWAKAALDLGLKRESVLLHADYHPDLGGQIGEKAGLSDAELFKEAKSTIESLDNYPDLIPEDNFIRPAVGLGIVGKYVWITPPVDVTYKVDLPIPWEISTLKKHLSLPQLHPEHDHIFDLDLDFFNGSKDLNDDIKDMVSLFKLLKPKVTTIAFSPASATFSERYLQLDLEWCTRVIAEIMHASGLKNDFPVEIIPENRRFTRHSSK